MTETTSFDLDTFRRETDARLRTELEQPARIVGEITNHEATVAGVLLYHLGATTADPYEAALAREVAQLLSQRTGTEHGRDVEVERDDAAHVDLEVLRSVLEVGYHVGRSRERESLHAWAQQLRAKLDRVEANLAADDTVSLGDFDVAE